MISKTSLFNKGIFKASLRRYAWGSILYAILLFLSTGMMIMLNINPDQVRNYYSYGSSSSILLNSYIIFPMLISVVVPTVAGLLIFRFMHSKKSAVFVHALPVKRSANYISSVLSALLLMLLPIVLNTVILAIMSASVYSAFFSIGDCITWMLLNIFSIFAMFSCVCFISSITGNSFAVVGLNIIFHIIGLVLAATFSVFAEVFLFGFAGEDTLIDAVFNNAFITRIPTIMTEWGYGDISDRIYFVKNIVIFTATSLVLYVLGGFIYSKRRMETAEDVAGFKCLNHIFKYTVTFVAALITFSVFSSSIYNKSLLLWFTVALVSGVVYFGSEMILRKSFRVWKTYKGFSLFLALFFIGTAFVAFTDFFGFETRIPKSEDIESVAVYEYYGMKKPVVTDKEVFEMVQNIHKGKSEEKTLLKETTYETRIHIEYNLKNGKTMERVYNVTTDELYEIMDILYGNADYKRAAEVVFNPIDTVYNITVFADDKNTALGGGDEKLKELVECIRKDITTLRYSQIHNGAWNRRIEIIYIPDKASESDVVFGRNEYEEPRSEYMNISINPNFEKTVEWIKQNGYWDLFEIKDNGYFRIAKDGEKPYMYGEYGWEENESVKEKSVAIEKDDVKVLIDYIHNSKTEYIPLEERYILYRIPDESSKSYDVITAFRQEEIEKLLPDYDLNKIKE